VSKETVHLPITPVSVTLYGCNGQPAAVLTTPLRDPSIVALGDPDPPLNLPPRGDDVEPSMGAFRVVVEPQFWSMMAGYPGFAVVNGVHRLVSPTLYDPVTVIGRSDPHQHGDAADVGGTLVGGAGTTISDSDLPLPPPGFQGPAGTPEIHTEIRTLDMVAQDGTRVRAGTAAPVRPISAGEIEKGPDACGFFPAESFFDVFVEVDLPLLGGNPGVTTLYNTAPLVVENSNLLALPPEVVYIHRHTGPAPIVFKNDDIQMPKRWLAGDRLGWLVLAGHGINFEDVPGPSLRGGGGGNATQTDLDDFLAAVGTEPEMADSSTRTADALDPISFAPPAAFVLPEYQDSLLANLDVAVQSANSGDLCVAVYQLAHGVIGRVDGMEDPADWVVDGPERADMFTRAVALASEYQTLANDLGGCTESGVVPPPFLAAWGTQGSGQGEFDSPEALAVDGQGAIYVADLAGDRVQKFSRTGSFVLEFGGSGSGAGQLDGPSGLAVDAAGNVYVTEYENHRVQKFSSSGAPLGSWGTPGSGDGQFEKPDGIAVNSGIVYVVDSHNHRIQRFSTAGAYLGQWGSQGAGPGQFNLPAGVAVDTHGDVYVSDANNNRIQKFTAAGTFLSQWGSLGTGPGQFHAPQGLSTDLADHVYVADYLNHRVQQFTPQGVFVTQWGAHGAATGQFQGPADVAVESFYNLYVADLENHRVQKFGRGEFTARPPDAPRRLAFSVAPNPARVARISFDLPQKVDVELAVFDLQGRRVATVFEGTLPAGRYTKEWSGATISGSRAEAGVYFYRLRAGRDVRSVRGVRIQ
jgi:sugar lactone lactonase YvrE